MPKEPFDPSSFVPTEFCTAADKADFGNQFLRFIETGWKQTLFTKKFYTRLSMCFGHIAHYNLHGFYETFFTCEKDRLAFIEQTMGWPCYGDPKFTFCDVERAIQRELRARHYPEMQFQRAAEEIRIAELRILQHLEAKYRTFTESRDTNQGEARELPEAGLSPIVAGPTLPIQGSLF